MIIEKLGDYVIEIIDDREYSENSTDNILIYKEIYKTDDERISTKHGIVIKDKNNQIFSSAIMLASGGATGIHERSYIIENNRVLLLCVSNWLFSLTIPILELNWKKEIDSVSAFGIYKMNDDYIVHGELEISRINKNGTIIWQNSGSDIFVLPNGINNFYIKDNKIYTQSWDERKYCFTYEGKIT